MPQPVFVQIQRLPHADNLALPRYQTEGSSGMDILAAVQEPVVLEPGKIDLIPTGLRFAIPEGFEIQVRPRSGLALKHGIAVLNSPGTIDADYRGEIQIILANLGPNPVTIVRGLRIAQLVLCRVDKVHWEEVDAVNETPRGVGGFGHTGL